MGLENNSNSFGLLVIRWLFMIVNCRPEIHPRCSGKNEKIQKRLITNNFKIKCAVPYAILLSETRVDPIEKFAMVRVIRYLKKMSKWKREDSLRLCLMIYCAKERRLGCDRITNGLVNGVFSWACVPQTAKR